MCLLINWWFIIFKKFPEIPVGKLIEQDFSGHYSGKSPEVTECLRSYSCFPSQNILHRNSCSISSKPIFDSCFRLLWSIHSNYDWFVEVVKSDSWAKFTNTEFWLPVRPLKKIKNKQSLSQNWQKRVQWWQKTNKMQQSNGFHGNNCQVYPK